MPGPQVAAEGHSASEWVQVLRVQDFTDKQTQEASTRASDILAKAQQAIELEHKKMLADARSEIARLVVTTTERVLAKKLTEADRASYNETASRELTSV